LSGLLKPRINDVRCARIIAVEVEREAYELVALPVIYSRPDRSPATEVWAVAGLMAFDPVEKRRLTTRRRDAEPTTSATDHRPSTSRC